MKRIKVFKVQTAEDLNQAQRIRHEVFVLGQGVPLEAELDRFESSAVHFLASVEEVVCGTARWRVTDRGVKLERFAVLEPFRKQGIGAALLDAVLSDIGFRADLKGGSVYLHAQLPAVSFYLKFGFRKEGEMFQECAINHFKMVLNP